MVMLGSLLGVQDICILALMILKTKIFVYDDFTASLSATLLIPEITTSDPLDILHNAC